MTMMQLAFNRAGVFARQPWFLARARREMEADLRGRMLHDIEAHIREAAEARRETRRELEGLTEAAYNRIADGGRAPRRKIHMTPEQAATWRRALGMGE